MTSTRSDDGARNESNIDESEGNTNNNDDRSNRLPTRLCPMFSNESPYFKRDPIQQIVDPIYSHPN